MKLLSNENGDWVPANLSSFTLEAELEQLLVEDTSLVPGCKGSAGVIQFPLAGGAADIVCLDEYGVVTIVECKLHTNREARRTVVGQIFAYASALATMSADDFLAIFSKSAKSAASVAVSEAAGHEVSELELRKALEVKFEEGSMRLVVAVDSVVDELRQTVEFLSEFLDPRIQLVALEVGQFQRDDVRLLALNSYGNDIDDVLPTSVKKAGRKWLLEEVMAAMRALPSPERAVAEKLLAHSEAHRAVFNGGTGSHESAGFYYQVESKRRSLWSFWAIPGNSSMSINIGSVNGASYERAQQLIAQLMSCSYFEAKLAGLSELETRYPTIPLNELAAEPDALATLLMAMTSAVRTNDRE